DRAARGRRASARAADHAGRAPRAASRRVPRRRRQRQGPRRLPRMSFDLTGRRALVTGARRGIGRAAAHALAEAGAEVVGVSASAGDDDEEFPSFRCDFGDRGAVRALVEQLPQIDVLVLNAGTIERKPAAEHGDDLWDRVLEVNLTAPFVLARELG